MTRFLARTRRSDVLADLTDAQRDILEACQHSLVTRFADGTTRAHSRVFEPLDPAALQGLYARGLIVRGSAVAKKTGLEPHRFADDPNIVLLTLEGRHLASLSKRRRSLFATWWRKWKGAA